MKRESGLFERIVRFDNLLLAARRAAQGKRDKRSVARFQFHLEQELLSLQQELVNEDDQPGAYFTFEVSDPKRRPICAAPFRERVLHHAVCDVLEPYLERHLIFDTYACRRGKRTHAAVNRAQQFAQAYRYFAKCDVRKFFQSIDHSVLQAQWARLFKDPALFASARSDHRACPAQCTVG